MTSGELILYTSEDGTTQLHLRAENGTVWLMQAEIAALFQTTKQNVSLHAANILEEGELVAEAVVKKRLTTASDGKNYRTLLYNLDMILAIGYRVRSHRGTQFRQWATSHLREYLVKGFVMDDDRLKDPAGWDYFDELLERIREIRAAEKRFYLKRAMRVSLPMRWALPPVPKVAVVLSRQRKPNNLVASPAGITERQTGA